MRKKKISAQAVEFVLTREIGELRYLKAIDIARNFGINNFYLSRIFKIDQKITLNNFILREKIYRAVFILEENFDKSIEELARELGFVKVADFNSEFKKYFTISPERYRDLRRKRPFNQAYSSDLLFNPNI